MASEGMDIPALDTVILASPKVIYATIRILRKHKHQSVVVDIVDYFHAYTTRYKKKKKVVNADMEVIKFMIVNIQLRRIIEH